MLTALIAYARRIRELRQAQPTNLEQALAPAFQQWLEAVLPLVAAPGLTVVPEFATAGIGRPDIALKRAGQPPRAFVELKAPNKPDDPARYKDAHDKRQHERFQSLPVWAVSNFVSLRVYHRSELIDALEIVPARALDPATTDANAERAIRRACDPDRLTAALMPLAIAAPPPARDADELAANLAHAARLVRGVIEDKLSELRSAGRTDAPLQRVRDEFRDVIYAHPESAGYSADHFDPLFAAAFAQTLAFGLLLVRETQSGPVDATAWRHMPVDHALLRTILRVLSEEEIANEIGVGFEVMIDAVNSFNPTILAQTTGKPDPILYFYEDFLRVFDPEARRRFGVYYTPVDVVSYVVSAIDRALRDHLGTSGLTDENVKLLDPATGTGTFLLGVIEHVRRAVEASAGPGAVNGALRALAKRIFGFEILVGPYAVAHYRLRHALRFSRINQRVGVYLTDALSRPGAAAAAGGLGFASDKIMEERREADEVKRRLPILAILGNPPYRRLAAGEVGELVGDWMNDLWDDLKAPVRDAGWGGELNTFPELSVAFWRWSLWKLFESEDAPGRGVVAFISNGKYVSGRPYAGLRQMMRERFDRIEIIDLHGDIRRGERAGVAGDEGVFDIQVGTAITLAIADGSKAPGTLAQVVYTDCWAEQLFAREDKLGWLRDGVATGARPGGVSVARGRLEDMKPEPFSNGEWVSLEESFLFKRSGIQTKRDEFVYAALRTQLEQRITGFIQSGAPEQIEQFNETSARPAHIARSQSFLRRAIVKAAYRPLDCRFLYNAAAFVDRPRPELQAVWGIQNTALCAMRFATGVGPAVWCFGLLPDNNAFSGRGGYAFPLRDQRPGYGPFNIAPTLLEGLAMAYGAPVSAQDAFDVILALLSAKSYTLRFAQDLEDTFPHVPFPADHALFQNAAALGRDIRAVQTYARAPGAAFLTSAIARVETTPTSALHAGQRVNDEIFLCADGSGRVSGVSEAVWSFSVSNYRLLPRWLEARKGLAPDHGFLTDLRDLVGRIGELIDLFDRADHVLTHALTATLGREALGLTPLETATEHEPADA